MYKSLKNALVSRINKIRQPNGDDADGLSTMGTTDINTEQYETGDGMKIIKTTVMESYGGAQGFDVANDAIGQLMMSDQLKIVQGLHETIDAKTMCAADSSDKTSTNDESDGGDESKIEIDKSLFNKYLDAAMRLQVSSTNGPYFSPLFWLHFIFRTLPLNYSLFCAHHNFYIIYDITHILFDFALHKSFY